MWRLLDQVRELQHYGPLHMNGRLLLVRCRLVKIGAPNPRERQYQTMVIDVLLRALRRQLGQSELTFQVSDSEILVVLMTEPVIVAVPMILSAIAELRRRLLGEVEALRQSITVDALSIREDGAVTATEIIADDGTVHEDAIRATEAVARRSDVGNLLKPGERRYSFTPVWDVRRKAITTYTLRCHADRRGYGEQTGYDVLHGDESPANVADLDLGVLERAGAELDRYRDGKMPFVLAWPLHAHTIEHAEKYQRYAATMARLARFIRSRMVVEVHGIRADWPLSRMQWVVGAARQYCRAVTVHLPFETTLLRAMASCGVGHVTVPIARQIDDGQIVPRLGKFRDAAARQGLSSIAHHVPSRAMAIAAVTAGFDYVHADFLGRSAKPEPAFHYDVVDLVDASADPAMGHAAAG